MSGSAVGAGIHPSASGVILAIAFMAAIIGARLWLLRDQQAAQQPEPQTRRMVEAARVVLVPVADSPYVERALKLAGWLAQERGAGIVLVYVIEVPRTLPLDAPIEEMEIAAALALATAREIVLQHHLPVRTVIRRARDTVSGIIAVAQEHHVGLLVVGVGPHHADARWAQTAKKLAQRAWCEVISDRLPD